MADDNRTATTSVGDWVGVYGDRVMRWEMEMAFGSCFFAVRTAGGGREGGGGEGEGRTHVLLAKSLGMFCEPLGKPL